MMTPTNPQPLNQPHLHHHHHHQMTTVSPVVQETPQSAAAPAPSPWSASAEEFLEEENLKFLNALAPTLVYILLLMAVGLVGNTAVFVIYYSRFPSSATRTFILAMSVCDLLTNALSLPADVVEVRYHNTFLHGWACKLSRTVKSFLGFLSACVLVAVAIDRCYRICSPSSKPPSTWRLRIIFILSAVAALVVTLPYTVLTGLQTVHYTHHQHRHHSNDSYNQDAVNITGSKCSIQDEYVHSLFLFLYNVFTGLIFVVCAVVMVVSYARIARRLWQHKKQARTVTGRALGKSDSDTASGAVRAAGGGGGESGRGGRNGGFVTYTDEETSMAGGDRLGVTVTEGSRSDVNKVHVGDGTSTEDEASLNLAPGEARSFRGKRPVSAGFRDGLRKMLGLGWPLRQMKKTTFLVPASSARPADQEMGEGIEDAEEAKPDELSSSCMALSNLPSTQGKIARAGQSCSLHSSHSSPDHLPCLGERETAKESKSSAEKKNRRPAKVRGSVRKIPTRTTFMMFVLTAVFIVNYLPYLIIVSLRAALDMELLVDTLGLNVYHIAIRSYFINSAANPLVYSFCSARFRLEFQRFFGCKV